MFSAQQRVLQSMLKGRKLDDAEEEEEEEGEQQEDPLPPGFTPPPIYASRVGEDFDTLSPLQKWQLVAYVTHFLLSDEGPPPPSTPLQQAAISYVYE